MIYTNGVKNIQTRVTYTCFVYTFKLICNLNLHLAFELIFLPFF